MDIDYQVRTIDVVHVPDDFCVIKQRLDDTDY